MTLNHAICDKHHIALLRFKSPGRSDSNGYLYAYYLGLPSPGTQLTIPSLAGGSSSLLAPIASVSVLGSTNVVSWRQSSTGLSITCPSPMPNLPWGTAVGFKIGPPSAIGSVAPENVIAAPGSSEIALSWSYPDAIATFNVGRATTSGGPYTPIATGLTGTTFNDTNVTAGTLYHYVVSAVDNGGPSVNSAEASASLAGPPASQWLTEDVGAVGAAGSFNLANGVFTIQGSGADIWYSVDSFRYVFQALSGDCSITARVLNMQNTAPWAKAGVMIRDTLDPSSQYVINFMSPVNGAALQERADPGGSASDVTVSSGLAAPYWVRLVRQGNVFRAYDSPDGVNWTQTGATTVNMSSNVYVGLAVCSVNNGTLCQAQFDNFSFSSSSAVTSSPLPALIHRYSFNETGGRTVHDSVGHADGTLEGNAHFNGDGQTVLDGSSGTYVSLPGDLLAGLSNVTIEAWVTNSVSPDNVALFSLDDGLQDGVGGGYLRYVLHDQGNARNFLELAGADGSPLVAGYPGLGDRAVHVVCVYNPSAGIAAIYINGVFEVSQAVSAPLNSVSTSAAALGRSPWEGDPWLHGSIDEFRIYSGQLLPADIAAAQIAGPDVPLTTNVALGVAQGDGTLTLSWPVAASGFALESSPALGTSEAWKAVTNGPSIAGTDNQVTVALSDSLQFFRLKR